MNTPDERVFGERRAPVAPPERGRAAGRLPRRPRRPLRGRGPGPGGGAAARPRRAGHARRLRLRRRGRPHPRRGRGRGRPRGSADRAAADPGRRRSRAGSSEAHLGVVPTLRDDFTELLLPVKLLEYVHMGLPVVASRLPVIERYFGDDVLLAEPGDPASHRRRDRRRAGRAGAGPGARRDAPRSGWPRSSGGASAAATWRWSTSSPAAPPRAPSLGRGRRGSGRELFVPDLWSPMGASKSDAAREEGLGRLAGGRRFGLVDAGLGPDRAEHHPDQARNRQQQADDVEDAAERAREQGLGQAVGDEGGDQGGCRRSWRRQRPRAGRRRRQGCGPGPSDLP